jgi:transposase
VSQPEKQVTNQIWHPDYGLTAELRIAALREAERTSAAEAAEMFNVHVSSVRRWRRRVETGE